MRRRLRQLSELHTRDWLVLLQLVPVAVFVDVAVRRTNLPRVVQVLNRGRHPFWRSESAPGLSLPLFNASIDERRCYQLADWAARLVRGERRCLTRSLLLQWLLAPRGQKPAVELGVALQNGELSSHAWVSFSGQPFGETTAAVTSFRTILRLD